MHSPFWKLVPGGQTTAKRTLLLLWNSTISGICTPMNDCIFIMLVDFLRFQAFNICISKWNNTKYRKKYKTKTLLKYSLHLQLPGIYTMASYFQIILKTHLKYCTTHSLETPSAGLISAEYCQTHL